MSFSVTFLFAVRFETMWFIWMYFAFFLSVMYISTIGRWCTRIIMLSSSVSSGACSDSPSSGFSSGSIGIGWYSPAGLFALLMSSASNSAISFRLLSSGREGANTVRWLPWSYRRLRFPAFSRRLGIKHFSAPLIVVFPDYCCDVE